VDEAAIRGGITLAKGMGQNGNYQLGLGHVRNCLEARAAVRQSQAKAQEAASAAQAQADSRKRAEQERRESDAAKRREHFASLPSKHQELYRQAARSEKYAPKGDDQRSLERIEAMAVELAWRSRMPEEAMA
jgi:predicted lipid-binding transport protein (Tim44 family)